MAAADDRIAELEATIAVQQRMIEQLEARIAELERQLGQNSGNSSKPPSRDPAAERQRQALERAAKTQRAAGGKGRRPGKQRGAKGQTLEMVDTPDEVIDHVPGACRGCGGALEAAVRVGSQRRQVIELPRPAPQVTEHRAHTLRCACGCETTATFPEGVRAPVSYGPTVQAMVTYLLARQHLPIERCAEAMRDLFGLQISTGTIDAIYTRAAKALAGFITALVAFLKTLPVLHADETSDRVGTSACWMHVVSTSMFTLIHASMTRGPAAIDEAGVLNHYRGVIVHDRLAMYFRLKRARHGICGAHLLRDLADDVAQVATQQAWATGLAGLLVEINAACGSARLAGHRGLAPTSQRTFAGRYDTLVADALTANPDPAPGHTRDYLQRRSYNLAIAFRDHRTNILRFMRNLDVGFTNNQAERDLRPTKLHRKISSCFRSINGAQRFAHVRSYLSTTRKHNISALDALTDLFNGHPWMPPTPSAT